MNTYKIQYDSIEEAQRAMASFNTAFRHNQYIASRNGLEITITPPVLASDMLNAMSFFHYLWKKMTEKINDSFSLAYRQYH